MVCGLCGDKIKKKSPHNTKKDGAFCDKCWKDYVKQNRQMEIETAIYGVGGQNE